MPETFPAVAQSASTVKQVLISIELAGEVNTNMPKWVLEKTELALKNRGMNISESKVLILGMAYKKNMDDLRD